MDISRGLEGVVVDTTRISLVDGVNGVLSYRGRNVENLIDKPFVKLEVEAGGGFLSRYQFVKFHVSPTMTD